MLERHSKPSTSLLHPTVLPAPVRIYLGGLTICVLARFPDFRPRCVPPTSHLPRHPISCLRHLPAEIAKRLGLCYPAFVGGDMSTPAYKLTHQHTPTRLSFTAFFPCRRRFNSPDPCSGWFVIPRCATTLSSAYPHLLQQWVSHQSLNSRRQLSPPCVSVGRALVPTLMPSAATSVFPGAMPPA